MLKNGPLETKAGRKDQDTMDFQLEIKSVAEDGSFEGYAAVFGNQDSHGDIVTKGAFKRTLGLWEEKGRQVPILWQHDPEKPIGVTTYMDEDDKGLKIKGQLFLEVQQAREAYALLKGGALGGLSIGYKTVKADWQGKSRLLREVKLFENSLVTFPSNELATASAKSEFKALDFAASLEKSKELRELSELRWKMQDALHQAVGSIMQDGDMNTAAKIDAVGKSCDQYRDAMVDWASRTLKLSEKKGDEGELELKALFDADFEVKAGRVLSAANESLVMDAITALSALLEGASGEQKSAEDDLEAEDEDPVDPSVEGGEPDEGKIATLAQEVKFSALIKDIANTANGRKA